VSLGSVAGEATQSRRRLDTLCVNTIKTLAMDMVQKAGSGHPGAPMGAAPMAIALWDRHLKHNPADPAWPDRDRFVLSPGHASALLYGLLHLTGYALPLGELERFRQLHSLTPGHPERGLTPGVEATTGPLGSGFATAVGMAIAERHLAARFNGPDLEIVGHFTYGICSDGDLMEGVSSEAASLAGTLGLGKLIFLYDDNGISIEGSTSLAFREDVSARFRAYGWQVLDADGSDVDAVDEAIRLAQAEGSRPSLIVARTVIAAGSPNKAGTAGAHGAPLGEEEVRLTKAALGWPEESAFLVPREVAAHLGAAVERGEAAQRAWEGRLEQYRKAYPEAAASWDRMWSGDTDGLELPLFGAGDGPLATRAASGKTLNAIAPTVEGLLGGSADLAPSNNTNLAGLGDLGPDDWSGRNLHFGVREFAMGCITNGLSLHGGLLPYAATFLVFSDYMRGAIRLAALQKLREVFVFTHDSIGVGEDGPTHQPVEQVAALRAIPGLTVIRPADANETAAAWAVAAASPRPTALILTRQGLPVLEDAGAAREGVARGAYVVRTVDGEPDVILIASGSEVSLALEARTALAAEGVRGRVVSMPSWELFEEQPEQYREEVLPGRVRARVTVEAGVTQGWSRYAGDLGETVGIDRFGASAPAAAVFEELGLTTGAIVAAAKRSLIRASDGA